MDLLEEHPTPHLTIQGREVLWQNRQAQDVLGPGFARLLTRDERRELLDWLDELDGDGGTRRILCRGSGNRATFWASRPPSLDGAWLLSCGVEGAGSDAVSLRRLRQAVETREIGIYEHDHITDVIYASTYMRSMWELGDSLDITISSFVERTHPDDRERFAQAIRNAHDPTGDGRFDILHRVVHDDGQVLWLHNCGRTYFGEDEHGQRRASRTVGSTSDMTELVLSRRIADQLRAVAEATPDVLVMASTEGRVTFVNASARALLGLDKGDSFEHLRLRDFIEPTDHARLDAVVSPGLEEEGLWVGDLELRQPDGDGIPASVIFQSLPGEESLPGFITLIARDLREKLALEEQLHHAQRLESIGRLAGGVAHDFNNFLSVMQCFAFVAREEASQVPKAVEALEQMSHAIESSSNITSSLLAFSRRQVVRPRVVSVSGLIERTRPILEKLVGSGGATIHLRFDLEGVDDHVLIDPTRLEQVLVNLAANARDAMPDGGTLVIETARYLLPPDDPHVRDGLEPGPHVLLSVSDTGVGMDSETLQSIFEPFFTTKPQGKGTGLGLATVFGLIKQSHGHVSVYSEVGRGTTFKVLLPAADNRAESHEPLPVGERGSAQGLTILVVEDEPRLRRVVVEVLRRNGLNPVAATGGVEALAIIRAGDVKPDLLLTDVVMPQMSGRELADALEADGYQLPVLFVSGYTRNSVVHQGVLEKGIHFLSKPFSPGQLVAAIESCLADWDEEP